jgi:hypothetical protein
MLKVTTQLIIKEKRLLVKNHEKKLRSSFNFVKKKGMAKIKKSVKLLGLKSETILAILVAQEVYDDRGFKLVITSVVDGKHRINSLHYAGYAIDIRLPPSNVSEVVAELKEGLGDEFDVVLESDHIHIEYQP